MLLDEFSLPEMAKYWKIIEPSGHTAAELLHFPFVDPFPFKFAPNQTFLSKNIF